jgi:hypothetical protein
MGSTRNLAALGGHRLSAKLPARFAAGSDVDI